MEPGKEEKIVFNFLSLQLLSAAIPAFLNLDRQSEFRPSDLEVRSFYWSLFSKNCPNEST